MIYSCSRSIPLIWVWSTHRADFRILISRNRLYKGFRRSRNEESFRIWEGRRTARSRWTEQIDLRLGSSKITVSSSAIKGRSCIREMILNINSNRPGQAIHQKALQSVRLEWAEWLKGLSCRTQWRTHHWIQFTSTSSGDSSIARIRMIRMDFRYGSLGRRQRQREGIRKLAWFKRNTWHISLKPISRKLNLNETLRNPLHHPKTEP